MFQIQIFNYFLDTSLSSFAVGITLQLEKSDENRLEISPDTTFFAFMGHVEGPSTGSHIAAPRYSRHLVAATSQPSSRIRHLGSGHLVFLADIFSFSLQIE